MLNIPGQQLRIFLCTKPTDMRKNFNGLTGLVRKSMMLDPLSGHLYIFRNQRGDRLKVLYWDGDGLALWYKQLRATCKDTHMNGIKFPRDPPSLSLRKAVTDCVRAISKQ